MIPGSHLRHEFVKTIPDDLAEGTVYVSIEYATVVHKCLCGCGHEVVTPLSPTDWKLTYDGESVTLHPSIGNWSFDCQSHYWIKGDRVIWAPRWTREEIEAGRACDSLAKDGFFGSGGASDGSDEADHPRGPIGKLLMWLIGRR